mgnify:FL=1
MNSPLQNISNKRNNSSPSINELARSFDQKQHSTSQSKNESPLNLQGQLVKAMARLDIVNQENENLMSENQKLKYRVAVLEKLKKEVADISKANQDLLSENQRFKKLVQNAEEKLNEEKKNVDKAYELVEAKERENQQLQAQLHQKNLESQQNEAEYEKVAQQLSEYKITVAELEMELAEKDQTIAMLEVAIKNIKTQSISNIKDDLDALIDEAFKDETIVNKKQTEDEEQLEDLVLRYARLEEHRTKLADSLGKMHGLTAAKRREIKQAIKAINEQRKSALNFLRGS